VSASRAEEKTFFPIQRTFRRAREAGSGGKTPTMLEGEQSRARPVALQGAQGPSPPKKKGGLKKGKKWGIGKSDPNLQEMGGTRKRGEHGLGEGKKEHRSSIEAPSVKAFTEKKERKDRQRWHSLKAGGRGAARKGGGKRRRGSPRKKINQMGRKKHRGDLRYRVAKGCQGGSAKPLGKKKRRRRKLRQREGKNSSVSASGGKKNRNCESKASGS